MSKLKLILKATLGLPLFFFINGSISHIIILLIFSLSSGYTFDQLVTSTHYIGLSDSLTYILSAVLTLVMYKIICEPKTSEVIKMCKFNKISAKKLIYVILFFLSSSILISLTSGIIYNIFPEFFKSYEHVRILLSYSKNSILGVFVTTIIAPIFEEIFCRGLIFGYLRRDCKLITALILQALAFALMHGNLFQGFYTFILGILLALMVYYTNSIYSSMIGHIIFNILGSGVLYYLSNYTILFNIIIINSVLLAIFTGIKLSKDKNLLMKKSLFNTSKI